MARKTWCFTWNNYTQENDEKLWTFIQKECEYAIYGYETAPNTGTKHIQGYLHFNTKKKLQTLKNQISPIPHWEGSKGTPEQNKTYCSKEGNFKEWGTLPKSTKEKQSEKGQARWKEMREMAKSGDFEGLESKYPKEATVYMRHFKEINLEATKQERHDEWQDNDLKSHFYWIWGPTGTGKSHIVHEIAKLFGERPYPKGLHKWWNGYRKQRVIHIEEATPKAMEYLSHYFKQWADKWGFQPEVKNSFIEYVVPEFIIVTSNYDMTTCFPETQDYEPLARRFTEVRLETREDQTSILNHFKQFALEQTVDPQLDNRFVEESINQLSEPVTTLIAPREGTVEGNLFEDLTYEALHSDRCSASTPMGNTIAIGVEAPPYKKGNIHQEREEQDEEVNLLRPTKRTKFVEDTLFDFNK